MKTIVKCYWLVVSEDEKNKLSEIGTFVMNDLAGWSNEDYSGKRMMGKIWNTGWQLAQEKSFKKCPNEESYYHYMDYDDKDKEMLLDMLKWANGNPKAPTFSSEILEKATCLFKDGGEK